MLQLKLFSNLNLEMLIMALRYGFSHQYSRLSTAEKYEKETNTWHKIASMNIARSGVGVVALGNKIYAIGGYDGKTHLK